MWSRESFLSSATEASRGGFHGYHREAYVMTAYGKVQSTDDFKRLAIKDFSEAQRLFRSREFYEVLKYENPRTFHLYDNMRKWALDEQAMEEFLVGIKQKECIFLTLQERVCSLRT